MAFNLTYDPNEDPEEQDAIAAEEQSALEAGQALEDQQSELLAGKFRSAADLEAAYLELQSSFTKQRQEEASQPNQNTEEQAEGDDLTALAEELRAEFEQYGQLTRETAAELGEELTAEVEKLLSPEETEESEEEEEKGVPLSAEETQQILDLVGGAEAYARIVEWALENLQEAEKNAFNSVVQKGDINAIYFAVRSLKSQFEESEGLEPPLLRGKASNNSKNTFRSMAELVRAQSDPRYDSDPAYRRDVMEKLERSGDLI